MPSLRTYLALGRISNLPTVWANIYCAWIIAGGQNLPILGLLLLGASLLYVAGMFMNDLCDADFDAQRRPERPIPSGAISRPAVRNATLLLAAAGLAAIAATGLLPAAFALALIALIALYNKTHKRTPIAPFFMAGCRALLYPMAAAAVPQGLDPLTYIAAGATFAYVLGVTYIAREESTTNTLNPYGIGLVAAPVLAAFYFRADLFSQQRLVVAALLGLWIALAFLKARVQGQLVIAKTIGPLLAALPLLDLLVLSTFNFASTLHAALFATAFALATATQRLLNPT